MFEVAAELIRDAGIGITRQEKNKTAKGEKPWPIYDSTYSEYFVRSFQDILPQGGLEGYLNRLSQGNNRKLQVLDIAGQGKALLDLKKYGVRTIAAVTLNDFRRVAEKTLDWFKGLKVIEGDISKGSTWRKIHDFKEKFDFITCRPCAAITLIEDPNIGIAILDKMYQTLAPGGILFTQLSPKLIQRFGTDWVEKLAATPGLTVRYRHYYLDELNNALTKYQYLPSISIIRHPDGPNSIKFIGEVEPNPENLKAAINSSASK